MSIQTIDLAVAANVLANFLMGSNIKLQLVWIKNNKGRQQPATEQGRGWLDSTYQLLQTLVDRILGCINYLCKLNNSCFTEMSSVCRCPWSTVCKGPSALETGHVCGLQAKFIPACWTQTLVIIQIVLVHKEKPAGRWSCRIPAKTANLAIQQSFPTFLSRSSFWLFPE